MMLTIDNAWTVAQQADQVWVAGDLLLMKEQRAAFKHHASCQKLFKKSTR